MAQYKVIKKAFGPRNPGEPHRTLEVGTIVTREDPKDDKDRGPGDAYERIGGPAKASTKDAVTAAQKRLADARKALKKADAADDADAKAKAEAEIAAAELAVTEAAAAGEA